MRLGAGGPCQPSTIAALANRLVGSFRRRSTALRRETFAPEPELRGLHWTGAAIF